MKVHGSAEVKERTVINMEVKNDVESASKIDQNHLKYILRNFWQNILVLAIRAFNPSAQDPRPLFDAPLSDDFSDDFSLMLTCIELKKKQKNLVLKVCSSRPHTPPGPFLI